jgi:hypothetical protein
MENQNIKKVYFAEGCFFNDDLSINHYKTI